MSDRTKFCIIAFDTSVSIDDTQVGQIYWKNLRRLYEDSLPKYNGKVYLIEWNTNANQISADAFYRIVNFKRTNGGTDPARIWPCVTALINKESLQNVPYDIIITTDGEVPGNTSYISNFNRMEHKPEKSVINFWGHAQSMSMKFLDGLPPPVEFSTIGIDKRGKLFEHKDTKTDTTQFYNEIIELPEYKLLQNGPIEEALSKENLSNLYITLYRKCAMYSEDDILTGDAGKVLKKYVDGINAMVHGHIYERLSFDKTKFDESFKDWRTNKDFIAQTFVESLESVTSNFSGQALITKINNLANGNVKIDRKLNTYGKDTYNKMKKALEQSCEADDASAATSATPYKTDSNDKTLKYKTISREHGYFVGSLLSSMKISVDFLEQKHQGLHLTIHDRLVDRYKRENNNEELTSRQRNMLEGVHYVQCPILLLNDTEYSSYVVLWIGQNDKTFDTSDKNTLLLEGPHGNLLKFDRKKSINVRRKLAKNPAHLFEVLTVEHLNRRIPPSNQQISVDAFVGLESTSIIQLGTRHFKKVYKSPLHTTECYGLILYNASTTSTDIDAPMSDSEFSVLIHNCSTLTWLLFNDGFFVGSYSLLYVFFLWVLYHVDRLQVDQNNTKYDHFEHLTNLIMNQVPEQRSYLQECVHYTIKRTVRMLKCNLMLFSGLEPTLQVPMMNAFIFHIKVFPECKEQIKEKLEKIAYDTFNSLRKTGYSSIQIANLSESVLDLKFEDKKQIKLWIWWHYMVKCELRTKWKLIHFKQIALSMTQNWIPVSDSKKVKLMLVEGKNEGKPYLPFLKDMSVEDVDRLLQLFLDVKKSPKFMQDLDKKPSKTFVRPKVIEKIPLITCVSQIKALSNETGALPVVCPVTNLPSKNCHEKQRIDFGSFGYNKKAIFGHSYFQACREWILFNSKEDGTLQIPNLSELRQFVVERTPMCVYPRSEELERELTVVVSLYNDWAKNLDKNRSSVSYWKKVWQNDDKMEVN